MNYTNPIEVERAREFTSDIETMVENGMFYRNMAEYILGESALPDTVFPLAREIEETEPIDESSSNAEDGTDLASHALGISKASAKKFLGDPQSASILFRSLRDKLEEMEYKKKRETAEKSGFIATVIYTIKRAMAWILKKFNDIKDDVLDAFKERPVGSSRAKRDYNWLKNKEMDYLATNTPWFINSEH